MRKLGEWRRRWASRTRHKTCDGDGCWSEQHKRKNGSEISTYCVSSAVTLAILGNEAKGDPPLLDRSSLLRVYEFLRISEICLSTSRLFSSECCPRNSGAKGTGSDTVCMGAHSSFWTEPVAAETIANAAESKIPAATVKLQILIRNGVFFLKRQRL